MFLTRLNLGGKLGLGFGITLAFMVAIAAMGIFRMSAMNDDLEQIVGVDNKKVAIAHEIMGRMSAIQVAARNLILSDNKEIDAKQRAVIDKARKELAEYTEQLGKLIESGEGKRLFNAYRESMVAARDANGKAIALGLENKMQEAIKVLFEQVEPLTGKSNELMEQITALQEKMTSRTANEAAENYRFFRLNMIFISVLAFVITGIMAFFLTRSITGPIRRVTEGLSGGADQVASASSQVASSSQNLAEGTSQQAAGMEETSSSLDEISSMTRQNAQAANDANQLMQETSRVVSVASASMNQLTSSMVEISHASEETQKIIKTIDEIAFQTNLLALNAAVEAARAGEAGAGFAVVADEVRNLAMRAADAAKNTADLIEGTVKKIKEGSDVVGKTSSEFSRVATSASKMGDLIGEIAAASKEQAQGIEQIGKGISEMDKIVQQNAASAEESASASEELNAQAEQMKEYVGELEAVIRGAENGTAKARRRTAARVEGARSVMRARAATTTPPKALATARDAGKAGEKTMPAREVSPEKVIPFDENEFDQF